MGIDGPKGRATFSLSAKTIGRLEEAVPKSERSRFVEAAIDEALRKEAVASLKQTLANFKAYSSGGEDSVVVLRRQRNERADYLAARHRPKR